MTKHIILIHLYSMCHEFKMWTQNWFRGCIATKRFVLLYLYHNLRMHAKFGNSATYRIGDLKNSHNF